MQLQPNLSEEDKQNIAKIFSEELLEMSNFWSMVGKAEIEDYLEDDLKRFPEIIKQEMMRRKAKVS